jgi:hypothetical protein
MSYLQAMQFSEREASKVKPRYTPHVYVPCRIECAVYVSPNQAHTHYSPRCNTDVRY